MPGVLAVGDVRRGSVKRVASAVGEGAIAVPRAAPLPRRGATASVPPDADSCQRAGPTRAPARACAPCCGSRACSCCSPASSSCSSPKRTATYFAWTIQPPLTAAFLGSAYWSAAAFEWSAATGPHLGRRPHRGAGRVRVHRAHPDRHLAPPRQVPSRELVRGRHPVRHVGVDRDLRRSVPILMVVLWLRQTTAPGVDPPRTHPYPMWLRVLVGVAGRRVARGRERDSSSRPTTHLRGGRGP